MKSHPMRHLLTLCLAAALFAAGIARADDAIKTVYHLSDERVMMLAMNNVSNQLAADPAARIVVVALSTGVRGFVFGAQDAAGRPYADWVDQLVAKGVEFRVCQNSMNALKITRKDLIDPVSVVPSGVAEIARLQAREGYAYIHP